MKLYLVITLCTLFLFLGSCDRENQASGRNPEMLRIGLVPSPNHQMTIDRHQSFKVYLQEKLEKQIEIIVTTDYNSLIEAISRGQVDIAYFGPLSYVIAKDRSEERGNSITPFACKVVNGRPEYRCIIIANKKAGLEKLEDVKGKSFAFGDPKSTSSHLIPRRMLVQIGLRFDEDYQANFVGSHKDIAKVVESGQVPLGGVSEHFYYTFVNTGVVDGSKIEVLTESAYYPKSPWVMLDDLDEKLKEHIKAAYYELDDPEILKTLKIEKWTKTNDNKFDLIRALMKDINFDTNDI